MNTSLRNGSRRPAGAGFSPVTPQRVHAQQRRALRGTPLHHLATGTPTAVSERGGARAVCALLSRRALCAAAAAVVVIGFARPALAGSYLDRAALLVAQATREADYLRVRLSDRELARTIHKLAAARVKAASTMQVPKEVAVAHPHLLLMLTNYERAADSAERGCSERYYIYQQRARDEEGILRAVLKQLGWPLPRVPPG